MRQPRTHRIVRRLWSVWRRRVGNFKLSLHGADLGLHPHVMIGSRVCSLRSVPNDDAVAVCVAPAGIGRQLGLFVDA